MPVVSGFFYLTHTQNTGGVFGIFPGKTNIFSIGTLIILLFLTLSLYFYAYSFSQRLAIYLVMGGALGNLFDRLYFGYVTDFLDFRIWPIFNLADFYVVLGVVIFLWKEFFLYRKG